MSDKNTLGIFEAGISQPDEMERLQPIIAPTIGVITNIGEAHQENFISSTQKCLEKLTLFNDCRAIIYDGDDAFIANCIESAPVPQSNHLESDRLGSPFVYRVDQETGFRNHYPLHAFRFRPDIHDSFYGRRFYRKRHPLYGRDVVSETDKRKRYRKFKRLEPVAMRLDVKQGTTTAY